VSGALAVEQGGQHCRGCFERGVDVGVAERVVRIVPAASIALRLGDPRLGADDRRLGAP
jgi:hypothetical protein